MDSDKRAFLFPLLKLLWQNLWEAGKPLLPLLAGLALILSPDGHSYDNLISKLQRATTSVEAVAIY